MGKFSGIFRTVKKVVKGILSVFSPEIPKAPKLLPPPSPSAAPTRDPAKEKAADDAARRTRLSEKRRRGRRASILANISEEDAQLANVSRPGLTKVFGS